MELEIQIPITHVADHDLTGLGPWDRARSTRAPPLDFWSRKDRETRLWGSSQRTRAGNSVNISDVIQHGFGNMHLDDWVAPEELVQPVAGSESDRRIMAILVAGNNNWIGPDIPTEANAVFEVQLNVSDFHPHELKVKICFGLVTVQGQHEEDLRGLGADMCDRWGHEIKVDSSGHASKRFKRTFTLPECVSEDALQAKLTDAGRLIISAPVLLSKFDHQQQQEHQMPRV